MKIELTPGPHLLRITILTPANLGSTGGSAALDRPVSVDAFQGLPYLPASSLRGVLAGRKGNVRDPVGGFNAARTSLYGSPDDAADGRHRPGEASRIVVGDGELLCFPCSLEDGARLLVIPVVQLARIIKIFGWADCLIVPNLRDSEYAATRDLSALGTDLTHRSLEVDLQAIVELAAQRAAEQVVLAGGRVARLLWRRSREVRTLTAVDRATKVVEDGSLRRIELITPGTVFVSFISVYGDDSISLLDDQPLQLGAWENIGLGYAWLDTVDPPTLHPPVLLRSARRLETESDLEVMRRVFEHVERLIGKEESAIAYSLSRETGPRWGARGVGKTLAFCLAKAHLAAEAKEHLSGEAKAYRWFLQAVFRESDEEGLISRVQNVIKGDEAVPAAFRTTLVWLSRYAEVLLKRKEAPS
ncbi:MAG: RAMP superfamily CRISPR-associated protein [Acidobacteriota bacterium]